MLSRKSARHRNRVVTAAHVLRAAGSAMPDTLAVKVDGRAGYVEFGGFESLDVATLKLELRRPSCLLHRRDITSRASRRPHVSDGGADNVVVAVRKEPLAPGTPLLLVSYATQDLSGGLCIIRTLLMRRIACVVVMLASLSVRWCVVARVPLDAGVVQRRVLRYHTHTATLV